MIRRIISSAEGGSLRSPCMSMNRQLLVNCGEYLFIKLMARHVFPTPGCPLIPIIIGLVVVLAIILVCVSLRPVKMPAQREDETG